MNDKQLPPLPDPHIGLPWRHNAPDGSIHSSAFTAEQMREYALQTIAHATQPAEVTDEQIESEFQRCGGKWDGNQWVIEDADLHPFARTILALRPTQVNTLAGCNCRWEGDTQVQWCELHLAHKEAIHEWAERAKSAEQKLALRPVQVPMTMKQIEDMALQEQFLLICDGLDELTIIVEAIEAHHGITVKVKNEAL